MSLSRLWQPRKQEEAHQLLSEIYGWFTGGFDTAALKKAKGFLREISWVSSAPYANHTLAGYNIAAILLTN
jgi:hypothetical protein